MPARLVWTGVAMVVELGMSANFFRGKILNFLSVDVCDHNEVFH